MCLKNDIQCSLLQYVRIFWNISQRIWLMLPHYYLYQRHYCLLADLSILFNAYCHYNYYLCLRNSQPKAGSSHHHSCKPFFKNILFFLKLLFFRVIVIKAIHWYYLMLLIVMKSSSFLSYIFTRCYSLEIMQLFFSSNAKEAIILIENSFEYSFFLLDVSSDLL